MRRRFSPLIHPALSDSAESEKVSFRSLDFPASTPSGLSSHRAESLLELIHHSSRVLSLAFAPLLLHWLSG